MPTMPGTFGALSVRPCSGACREFGEMRRCLARIVARAGRPSDWSVPRLDEWRYAANLHVAERDPAFFQSNAYLWRDDNGSLRGFCVAEFGGDSLHIQAPPADVGLVGAMIEWMAGDWVRGRRMAQTFASSDDRARMGRLAELGFEDRGPYETVWRYDLARDRGRADLPAHHVTGDLRGNARPSDVVEAVNESFGHARDTHWLRSRLSAPSLSDEWVLVASAPDQLCVACCFVWIDEPNRSAEIGTVGTRPKYRRRGLARALLTDAFSRLRRQGVESVYVRAAAGSDPAEALYDSLAPDDRISIRRWAIRPPSPGPR
jgi:ribosomal protein S18 acetylase RimI-like enzyme